MRIGLILAIAGMGFAAGCGDQGKKASDQSTPKWHAPYRISFDAQATKPNPSGVTLPSISYNANSKVLERRAVLVVRLDPSIAKDAPTTKDAHTGKNQMIMGPVDIPTEAGILPASYVDQADKGLAKMLSDACLKGTVKINVALVRSSIKPDASDAEIDAKRLTEWFPTEVTFKNKNPKC